MLKRTQILLGLTIAASIVVSLFLAGCGGNSSNPVTGPSVESNALSRLPGNGSVTLVSAGSPAVINVHDPDGLCSITVRDSAGGRLYLFAGRDFPKGATDVKVTLKNFGQVAWHWVGFVDMQWSADSAWKIYSDGRVERIR